MFKAPIWLMQFQLYYCTSTDNNSTTIKSSLEPAVFSWNLESLSLRFKSETQPICLFESHSVQQKLLVSRFYSCVNRPAPLIVTSDVWYAPYYSESYFIGIFICRLIMHSLRTSGTHVERTRIQWRRKNLRSKLPFKGINFFKSFKVILFNSVLPND